MAHNAVTQLLENARMYLVSSRLSHPSEYTVRKVKLTPEENRDLDNAINLLFWKEIEVGKDN